MTDETGRTTRPAAGGEMAGRIRAHDWAGTPLGPLETWPQSLKTVVDLMTANPVANILVCGPERILLYNDACIALYGDKHPGALGSRGPDAFPELWDEIGPLYDRVFAGEALRFEAQPWAFERGTETPSGLYDAFFAPGRDESGQVAFAYVTAVEVTDKVRLAATLRESEERQTFLLDLNDRMREAGDAEAVIATATRMLGEKLEASRIVFAEIDEAAGVANIRPGWTADGAEAHPAILKLADFGGPLLEGLRAGRTVRYDDVGAPPYARPDLAALAAIGIGAGLSVPLLIGGHFVVNLNIHQHEPRTWTDAEIALVEEVAERIWAAVQRVRAEAALGASEERQVFLLTLSDALRSIVDPIEIQIAAARMLGEQLGVDRIGYGEVPPDGESISVARDWSKPGVPSAAGTHRLADWGAFVSDFLKTRRTASIADAEREAGVSPEEYERSWASVGVRAAIAYPIVKQDRVVAALFVHSAAPREWSQAQIDLVKEVGDRTRDAVERARVEAALGESEKKYRTLFETMGQGYCELELVRDDEGRAVDQLYLEFNPAYERLIGIPVSKAKGRRASEVMPGLESWWTQAFDRIAKSGEPERIEHRVSSLDRWFEVWVYPRGADHLTVLYEDITDRKRAEQALHESEERQRFLLKLSDELRPLEDATDIKIAAATVLGRTLGANHVIFGEDQGDGEHILLTSGYLDGVPDATGVHKYEDYAKGWHARLKSGEILAVADIPSDPEFDEKRRKAFLSLGMKAVLTVPLIKAGRLVTVLAVNFAEPHRFTDEDIALTSETAERTWAAVERARAEAALRESEEEYRQLFTSMGQGFCIHEKLPTAPGEPSDYLYVAANPAFERQCGISGIVGKRWREVTPHLSKRIADICDDVVENGGNSSFVDHISDLDMWFEIEFFPARLPNQVAVLFTNITERKRAEANAALLAGIADDLSRLVTPDDIITAVGRRLGEALNLSLCHFVDVNQERGEVTIHHSWEREGLPSAKQTFRIADFLTEEFARSQRVGETFIVRDTITDERTDAEAYAPLSVASIVAVPFHRGGTWVAYLSVTDSAPRDWRADEIELIQQVAERVFPRVERARAEAALRDSEQRLSLAIEATDLGIWEWELESDRVVTNDRLREQWALDPDEPLVGPKLIAAIHPQYRPQVEHILRVAMAPDSDGHYTMEYRLADDVVGGERWIAVEGQVHFVGAGADRRPIRVLGTTLDITESKRMEIALRESEERQAFLLRFSDALRAEEGVETVGSLAARMIADELVLDRVYFVTANSDNDEIAVTHEVRREDMPPMLGMYRSSDFPNAIEEFLKHKIVYTDVRTDPRLTELDRASFAGLGAVGFAAVPINRGGEGLIWAVGAVSTEPRQWTASDIVLLEEAAERTWAAIERARADAAVRESEAELAHELANTMQLQDISSLLIEGEDEEALYGRLLDAAMAIMRADFASIQSYDPENQELGLLAHRNFHPESVEFWDRVSISTGTTCGGALREGERMFAPDVVAYDPDGREHYRLCGMSSVQSTPLTARDGRLIGMLSTHWRQPFTPDEADFRSLDILARQTADAFERSRAEAALRESEARLAAIFAHAPVGLSEIAADGRFLAVNQEMCRITGRSREEMLALGIAEVTHPDDLDRSIAVVQEVLDTGEARALDKRYQRPNGDSVWANSVALRMPAIDHAPGSLIIVTTDLTERRRAEAALRESEERFRQFGAASSDVLWIRGVESLQWEYLSDAFDSVYGQDRDAALTGNNVRRWAELILPEDRDKALDNLRRVFDGERVTHEFRIRRPSDGKIRWIRNTDFPLLDAAGKVERIGGIGHDATEEKEMSDRLHVLIAELQHRTRNIIAVVQSLSVKTRRESISLDDFQARFGDRLHAVSRVQGLLSRLREGRKVTFDQLLHDELSAVGAMDGHAERVTLEGPAGVPLRSTTVQTFALALHELATNAVKYGALASPNGHLAVRWHAEEADDGPQLRVEWRESGVVTASAGAAPEGGGYGRELIERALPYQLHAKTRYDMTPDGVHCTITLPIAQTGTVGDG